jgi:hypothetical protein
MEVHQRDIALHGFNLTASNKLPNPILNECSRNADIWWHTKNQHAPDPMELS